MIVAIIEIALYLQEGEKMQYDYLIIGTGLYGAVVAQNAIKQGKKVLMIEKRDHVYVQ